MRFLSVCSGIEAVSVAWHPLGFECVGVSEIDKFPCSVLQHRFPDIPNFGDMNNFEEWPIEPGSVDLLVGGTPCQSFSIAGLRGGLEDDRGNLALTYCRILDRFRPRWFVWENVPGVLSSNGGRDFGSILGAMEVLGYGIAYRILDAQYFGVPQRRRRVFVVGCLGDWRRAAEVLFEPGCVRGDSQKGGKKRKDVTGTLASRTSAGSGLGTDFDLDGGLIAGAITGRIDRGGVNSEGGDNHIIPTTQFRPIAGTLTRRYDSSPCHDRGQNIVQAVAYRTAGDGYAYHEGDKTAPLTTATDLCSNVIAIQERAVSTNETNGPQGSGFRTDGKAYTLEARNKVQAVAFAENSRAEVRLEGGNGDRTGALSTGGGKPGQGMPTIAGAIGVRRLTPRECERLQGFPDDWTLVPHRGKPAADGPRYKAIGNSMAVPVMRWIGQRIQICQ